MSKSRRLALIVGTAILAVAVSATPGRAEIGTWFCDAAGGVEISVPFEVPCGVLNAQSGSPIGLTNYVVMAIELQNVTGADDHLAYLRIESRNTQPGLFENMKIYMESGIGTPTGPEDFDPGTDTQVGATADLSADDFWDQNGPGVPPPTVPAVFDFTGEPGGGISIPAAGAINLYVVVEFRSTILGDPALLNAAVGVALDGDLPSIECLSAGNGPMDVDGPTGTPQVVVNDPMYIYRLETRTPQFDFAAVGDASPNPVYMGKWDIDYRNVIGPYAGQNRVVMGLWFDNTHGGVQDAITAVKLRSRVSDDYAIKRVDIYRETDCIVPTDRWTFNPVTDQLWFVDLSPGAWGWNKNLVPEDEGQQVSLNIVANPGAGILPAGSLVYLYVVVNLDPDVIAATTETRERYTYVEVGVALNDATPGVVVPEAFTLQSGVKGPRQLVGDDAALVHNELAAPDDIYNWDSGAPQESGGQPYIIDALSPQISCATFGPGASDWTHVDQPSLEDGGLGDEVIDNFDELTVRTQVIDPGPANLITTGSNRPRVDMRPFGGTTYPQLMDPEAGDQWMTSVVGGYIPDSDDPSQRTDTAAGQLFILFQAMDDAGNLAQQLCPVNKPVDTRRPSFDGVPITFGFAPGGDLNEDGVAGVGDRFRITCDMSANWHNWNKAGQTKEIQSVVADLTSWEVLAGQYDPILDEIWDGYVTLNPSSDNQYFARDFTVLQGTHEDFEVTKMNLTAIDNANNVRVSADQYWPGQLDNQPPMPSSATWTLYFDYPDNNIVNIGDQVRFTVDLTDPSNDDVVSVAVDLFEAGLGGPHQAFLIDLLNDGNYRLDWAVLDPRLNGSAGFDRDEDPKTDECPIPAVPIDNGERYTIDIVITDDAGNEYTATVGDPVYPHLEGNPAIQVSVDTRVPEPVMNLTAYAMDNGAIELNWMNPPDGDSLAATKDGPLTFDIYWDAGTGTEPIFHLAEVLENSVGGCVPVTSWNTDQAVPSQNLDCGFFYKFRVTVRDNANNTSDTSNTVAAVTCDKLAVCYLADEGPGSLRASIDSANSFFGPDTIRFYVLGTIHLNSPLPPLSDASGGTFIDGLYFRADVWGDPEDTIDGSALNSGSGLEVTSDDNIVEGLALRGFPNDGITVEGSAHHNEFSYNRFFRNSDQCIDLGDDGLTPNDAGDVDSGPNDLLNFPVFDSIRELATDLFTVFGTAPANSAVELYLAAEYGSNTFIPEWNNHGPAYALLGLGIADGSGFFEIDSVAETEWSLITATATDQLGNTSEFSRNQSLSADPIRVTAYTDQLLVVVSGPPDSTGHIDSIGVSFNSFGALGYYDQVTDYNGDAIPDTRVTIASPDTGLFSIRFVLAPDSMPGSYLTGIGINGHLEATQTVTFDEPGAEYNTTHHHAPLATNRGDLDRDGFHTTLDIGILIDYLYAGLPDPPPDYLADVDCDGFPTTLDLGYLISYVFEGGPMPCLK